VAQQQVFNLEQLLTRIASAAEGHQQVSLGMIVEAVGRRSFGPLLLMAGIVLASPLSGIPGMPTVMGLVVTLIACQLLLGSRHFWLPRWLLRRSLDRRRICRTVGWLSRPARVVDRWVRPRLTGLHEGPSLYLIALVCGAVGIVTPVMELIPFSAHAAGAVVSAFGLSLIAHDGLLTLLAFSLALVTIGVVVASLL
jgi:hypothetical protein